MNKQSAFSWFDFVYSFKKFLHLQYTLVSIKFFKEIECPFTL